MLFSALNIKVESNIVKLLPEHEPSTQSLLKLNKEEGGTNFLNITLSGGTAKERKDKAKELADAILERTDTEYVLYDLEQLDEELRNNIALLQLSKEELQELRVRLKQGLALGPNALSPLIAPTLFNLGPLTSKLNRFSAEEQTSSCVNSFINGGQDCDTYSQMIIRPRGSPFDNDFSIPFMAEIDRILADASFEESEVEVAWIGGAYRHSVEDIETVIHDVYQTAGLSFILVLSFISIVYREKRALLIIFVPLLVGNVWTWGFTYWFIGELNSFTSFSSAILVGLGVDFAIHLYSRYQEERVQNKSVEEALVSTWSRVGPPCTAAALTSAGGFFALRFGNFLGFQQLGLILTMGILLCLLAILTLLPLMIVWRERHEKPLSSLPIPSKKDTESVFYRYGGIGLFVLVCGALLSLTQIPKIQIEYDLSKLRKSGMAYSDMSEEKIALVDRNFSPVVVGLSSRDELIRAQEVFSDYLGETEDPYIGSVLSIYSFLPADQEERVAELQKLILLAESPNLKFLPQQVQKNLMALAEKNPKTIQEGELPVPFRHLLGIRENTHRLLVFPKGNMWDVRENNAMAFSLSRFLKNTESLGLEGKIATIDAPLDNTIVAGDFIARSALFRLIKDDAPRIAGLAFGMIFLFSFLDIRSIPRAVSASLVLGMGLAFTGAAFVGMKFNISMISFVCIPILMGVGIDVIIHLIHRIAEEGPGGIGYALQTTGKASLFSAGTTVLSFSSLLIASNIGIYSLGLMTVVGLAIITTCAFTVIPCGWMLFWRTKGRLEAK
ncbi:MAG: MMPL family transporter [Myxococcota bacterium]|nr:MMPL family transporter [Myxococcota bacterium]